MSGVKTEGAEHFPGEREAAEEGPVVIAGRSYLRAPVPILFPEFESVPETKRHLEQRTTLYQILKLAFAERNAIGSDQFVYWNPTDPRDCLAPDAFVRFGVPDNLFGSWKVWERGAPEVAIEIISASDARDRDWEAKLHRYRRLGVRELVRFDSETEPATLRVWDVLDGDLVERREIGRIAPSYCLPGAWVITDTADGPFLRLSQDAEGERLYPTPVEREAAARTSAEERIRELEAQLRSQR